MCRRNSSSNTWTRLCISRLSPVGSAHFCPSVELRDRTRTSSMSRSEPRPDSSASSASVASPVPNLHAGHCPQDSTARNREYRYAACTMHAESSNTANPPAPRPEPTSRIESKYIGVSSSSGTMTVFDAPGKIALIVRPSGAPPPASSTRARIGEPRGSSNTPSRRTSPQTVNTMVPGEWSVPFARSQAGPSRRMCGTLASVSTLFTSVGLSSGGVANNPWMKGRAVRIRGLHLLQRPSERLELRSERLLQAEERTLGSDRVCGDGEALQDLVRVRAEQRPVLERRRLALGGVADGEPRPGADGPDRAPFVTGGEPGAAAAPEAALRDLLDHGLGPGAERDGEPVPASRSGVLLEGSRGQIE